ncbi:hypothetical protein SLEP1_g28909 [Rubroshorea leprosula]|uniref:Uncharacterized protein n=1 Tax=Rubroshorea leprosula TaxID=152421 RepID=A0AAV5K2A2_9ROSI|nr:hypothetical protein SLEP1_g28909 [Rubroshorea leprosula]
MNNFLRKSFVSSSRNSLLKIVAIATAGSGFLYANCNSNYKTRVSLSIPAQLRESGLLPRQFSEVSMQQPLSIPAGFWNLGKFWQFSSRVSPEPAGDVKKEVSFKVGDDAKPCSRCLGRDSIANAAAKVGPAVVNLSVPQGVTLQDGRTFEGTVVNADLHSDIAIVKIKSKTPLPAAKLGSSSKLCPGDWVLALGCPLSLQNTVTAGIVSCVDRKSSDLGLGGMHREYLQTDCAINPALINCVKMLVIQLFSLVSTICPLILELAANGGL